MNTAQLVKGDNVFLFAWESGDEAQILDQLTDWAKRPDVPFDWFDAALISHKVGRIIAKELKAMGGTPHPEFDFDESDGAK